MRCVRCSACGWVDLQQGLEGADNGCVGMTRRVSQSSHAC